MRRIANSILSALVFIIAAVVVVAVWTVWCSIVTIGVTLQAALFIAEALIGVLPYWPFRAAASHPYPEEVALDGPEREE